MKTLPVVLSKEVADYLVSALARQGDATKEASLVWAQQGWIGEETCGAQVILGFFAKGKHSTDCLYSFGKYVIAMSEETLSQLTGKKLVFERFEHQTASGTKAIRIIRAVDIE